jgi:hypothetical protein
MFRAIFDALLSSLRPRSAKTKHLSAPRAKRFVLAHTSRGGVLTLESLEGRAIPAVTAILQGAQLIVSDDFDNNITISRDAAGTILVNDGQVLIVGATPTDRQGELS